MTFEYRGWNVSLWKYRESWRWFARRVRDERYISYEAVSPDRRRDGYSCPHNAEKAAKRSIDHIEKGE